MVDPESMAPSMARARGPVVTVVDMQEGLAGAITLVALMVGLAAS